MKLNINCMYTMNLQILPIYVPIDPKIDCPTEKLLTRSYMQHLIPYCLVCYCLLWRMNSLLAIESLCVWPVSWLEAHKKICKLLILLSMSILNL